MRHTRMGGLAVAVAGLLAVGGLLSLRQTGPAGATPPPERPVAELVEALHGPAAAPAVGRLVALLGDPDAAVRINAAKSLGRIGPEAVGPLLGALRGGSADARAAAAEALGAVGPAAPAAVAPLVTALYDP